MDLMDNGFRSSVNICKNCQILGHTQKWCKNNPSCPVCNLSPHSDTICSRITCANCYGEHTSSDKTCPKYQQIKEILTIKTLENISIGEARKYKEQHPIQVGTTVPFSQIINHSHHKQANQAETEDISSINTQKQPSTTNASALTVHHHHKSINYKSIANEQNSTQHKDGHTTQNPKNNNNNNITNQTSKEQLISLLSRYTSHINDISEIPTTSTITDLSYGENNNTNLSNQFEDISDNI
ncbi:probable serine/threonine-protein kinase fhkE [Bactrocera tryoni]|uniref:probable serine/threonine-protein kinase fhkE n=1 Tax=Bactrocera tryoni TaxID=59916 RepID=UPI001A95EC18|nr:probable serine/threonine-protein kinase fhkE [Bactrocera tryoni]